MRIFSALLMISVASTGAAVAGPFDGIWDSSQEACALDMNDFRLTISGNTANYWESSYVCFFYQVQPRQLTSIGWAKAAPGTTPPTGA